MAFAVAGPQRAVEAVALRHLETVIEVWAQPAAVAAGHTEIVFKIGSNVAMGLKLRC